MPRRPDFEPVETPKGWMVSVPPSLTVNGKRVRRFFADWKEANVYAGRLRKTHGQGLRGALLPAALAMDAGRAAKLLEPLGISLTEAARMAVEALRDDSARELFRDRYRQAMAAGEGVWSDRYARDMEKIPKWLGEAGMKMHCGELTVPVVEKLLRASGAKAISTLEARRTRVLAVLHWKPRTRKTSAISMMTLRECAAVLRACETREQVRAVALLLFAGIRPDAEDGEMSRLQWEDVGSETIYVRPEISKTGSDRHVPVTPRLRRLLAGHPPHGAVIPPGWRRAWQRIRKTAGIVDRQDVLRHAFGSHFLAAFGEEAAKQAMGHTAGSATLFRHYRRAVTAPMGRKFFGVKEEVSRAVDGVAAGSAV